MLAYTDDPPNIEQQKTRMMKQPLFRSILLYLLVTDVLLVPSVAAQEDNCPEGYAGDGWKRPLAMTWKSMADDDNDKIMLMTGRGGHETKCLPQDLKAVDKQSLLSGMHTLLKGIFTPPTQTTTGTTSTMQQQSDVRSMEREIHSQKSMDKLEAICQRQEQAMVKLEACVSKNQNNEAASNNVYAIEEAARKKEDHYLAETTKLRRSLTESQAQTAQLQSQLLAAFQSATPTMTTKSTDTTTKGSRERHGFVQKIDELPTKKE
jgi:hypothetical protein